ncbi:Tyrosine recombinase XerC [subsurface metagenome]
MPKYTYYFTIRCLSRTIGIELTPEGINEFLSCLSGGNAKHAHYRALRVLCNWLYKQGYLSDNPVRLVDLLKIANKLLTTITLEQLEILLKATDSLRDQCILSLLFDSGLRLNETYDRCGI